MELFLNRFFDGLTLGAIYGVLAVSLVLIFKATSLINFAQGELAAIGGYVTFVLWERVLPIWFAIPLAMLVVALLGAGVERVLIRPFDTSNPLPIVLITLGLSNVILGTNQAVFGNQPRGAPDPFPSGFPFASGFGEIAGARLFNYTIGILTVLAVSMAGLYVLLNRTKVGLAFRAVSSNLEASQLMGIRTGRTLQFGWAIAAGFGALGASLVMTRTNLQPTYIGSLLIFAFAAAALGGLDSVGGAVVGGMCIGWTQSLGVGYLQTVPGMAWVQPLSVAVAFTVILLVLLIRPSGLFGTVQVSRV